MAGGGSSAGFDGESACSDDWLSLLRDTEPDDVEEVAFDIVLTRSRLDQVGSDGGCSSSSTPVARRRSAVDVAGPSR